MMIWLSQTANQSVHATTQDRLKDAMRRVAGHSKLLIIDELGYLPINKMQANYLFQIESIKL